MHRWSELFIPTLREAPADAEVASHKFLVRAGYVRQLAAGIYSYLFIGQRSFNKIMNIVRQEMDTIGQEFFLPAIHPRELWEESGRWTVMGQNMFRLKDRKGAELALGMTHEEVMMRTPAGEDLIVSCEKCNYAANMEKATSQLEAVDDLKPEGDGKPLLVHTPGQKTIEDVARYLGVSPKNKIKTLALMANEVDTKTGKPKARDLVVLLRGDHQLNEAKLSTALAGKESRPMQEDEIKQVFHSPAGFLGPLGLSNVAKTKNEVFGEGVILLVDKALEGRANLISGANKADYHLKNVTPGRDFEPTEYADLRSVNGGEECPNCGAPLRIDTAVEIGHIFKLGYKYSESMGARVLDRNGKEVTPSMGSYGIGIERILTAAIEQSNDENGFWLPPSIAPFEVLVVSTNSKDEKLM